MGAFVTVDDTDFPINEPSPFSSTYFSHKINGPALRYEVAVSVGPANIVWAHGPFKAGTPD